MHRAFASSNNQRERERERERDDGQTCLEQIKSSGVSASAIFPSFSKGVGNPFRSTFDSTHPRLSSISMMQRVIHQRKNYVRLKRFNREAYLPLFPNTRCNRGTEFRRDVYLLPRCNYAQYFYGIEVYVSLLFFFRRGSERKSVPRSSFSLSFGGGFCPLPPCKRRRIFASEDVIFSKNLSNNERL